MLAASSVAAVRARKRLGLPGAAATVAAFGAPAALAWGFGRSKRRDMLLWASQMWAYKDAFEIPSDDKERLRGRTHLDYPIAMPAQA
jgi:hypothetical protein